jgi:aspartyl-tRNA(Asn)/glutamyl-tRNA(Gln) amidotransferase subunit B
LDSKFIGEIQKSIPESPEEKLEKFVKKHKLGKEDAEILVKNIDIAEFYEKVSEKIDAGFALTWVTIELLRLMNDNKVKLADCDIKVEHFVKLLEMVKNGKISVLQGKQKLKEFYPKSFDISDNIKERITDEKEIEKIVEKVIKSNSKAVGDYKSGDSNALNFLIGAIMKESQKRADYAIARKVLTKLLK